MKGIRQCQGRVVQAVSGDLRGNPVFMPDFIGPMVPPMISEDEYVRFVSRIPFEEDIHLIDSGREIWCSASEFIDLMGGDWEEHAILLCNYFQFSEAQDVPALQAGLAQCRLP